MQRTIIAQAERGDNRHGAEETETGRGPVARAAARGARAAAATR